MRTRFMQKTLIPAAIVTSRGQHQTGFRLQLLGIGNRRLAALRPGLLSTYRFFDGGVHTDIVASTAPKVTQKQNRKGKGKTPKKTTGGAKKGKTK